MLKGKFFGFIVLIALLTSLGYVIVNQGHKDETAQKEAGTFDKSAHSLTEPSSFWVVVNKSRQLTPPTFAPTVVTPHIPLRLPAEQEEMQVRPELAAALEALVTDAKKEGLQFMLASGYRSYKSQVALYNGYVQEQGKLAADAQSARPGYSEHQTGLAADLEPTSRTCEIETCFADTPEGKWLAQHAHEYGLIIRYAKDEQTVTGYVYEPWHVRFVGKPLATEMRKQHIATLEVFFGLPPAPTYL